MLKKLKYILNSFSDEELENTGLWINGRKEVNEIIVEKLDFDDFDINLITKDTEIKINNLVDKEGE